MARKTRSHRERRAVSVLGIALALFWLLAFLTYRTDGIRGLLTGVLPADVCGFAGHRLAGFTMALLGASSGLALPLLALVGALRLWGGSRWLTRLTWLGLAGALFLPIVLGLAGAGGAWGGAYGHTVSRAIEGLVGVAGAWLLLIAAVLTAVLILTDWSGGPVARGLLRLAGLARRTHDRVADAGRALRMAWPSRRAREPVPEAVPPAESALPVRAEVPRWEAEAPDPSIVEPAFPDPIEPRARTPKTRVHRDADVRKRPASEFALPPVSLLSTPPAPVTTTSRAALLDLSETLRRTLEEFGIRGRVGEVHPGPVITRYDFEPAPGIKVNQIMSREDDIALALRTDRVRILSRIPGKAAVGIEIPNDAPDLIPFKDVVASGAFKDPGGVLTLALGKDASGRPFADRLEAMPHLLVAGTTGSGKSVCINTIIASLLFRHRPDDLRLILIDPKMLELTGFNHIPHLALPVVTDSKEASKALNWLVREMERRYKLLAGRGVRNIKTYHDKFFPGGEAVKTKGEEEPPERMPYIVCVVDELADLMMTFASEIETPIARLAQMARAVGIHLILATQRPSVDVLTGVIKANFPARIAFQVASRTDSRTILDQNGAESLIGRGDMLYQPAGRPSPIRVHGAFLPDEDIEALVAYLRGFASDVAHIELDEPTAGPGGAGGHEDPLFGEAARIVVLQGQASTSFLQRRLKVGYARAGRLMDELEQEGIVSPFEGSKARDVLVDMTYLEEQDLV